ncbi:MAG: DUF484 family protein [Rhodospirillales bacterium]|nr:DUF484 family protein [Rhodospirillales bacterium]
MPRNRQDPASEGAAGKAPAGKDADVAPSAAQVAGFLRRNPDFLAEHPDLLEVLTPPTRPRGDGVLDLQSYMVERLRDEVQDMTTARDDLVRAGRSNMAAQARIHQAVLALLAAKCFEHLIEIVTTDLAVMLDLDAVTLGVEKAALDLPPVRLGGLFQLEPDTVDSTIGKGRKVLLRSEIEGDPAIYGAAAGLVASEALIRLQASPVTPPAILALGSRKPEQFHPGQGTELLAFLADALELSIRTWLDLPD